MRAQGGDSRARTGSQGGNESPVRAAPSASTALLLSSPVDIVHAVLTVLLVIVESQPFIVDGISVVFIFPCENHGYDDLVIYVTLGDG